MEFSMRIKQAKKQVRKFLSGECSSLLSSALAPWKIRCHNWPLPDSAEGRILQLDLRRVNDRCADRNALYSDSSPSVLYFAQDMFFPKCQGKIFLRISTLSDGSDSRCHFSYSPIKSPAAKCWLIGRSWCLWRWKTGGEGNDRGWNGWMASQTQWTWVWANSGRWWRTGKPGVLQFMGLQRVRHYLATEQQQIKSQFQ